MKKIAIAFLLMVSSQAFACPDLTGNYMFSSGTTLVVSQYQDEDGSTIYNFTTDNGVCEACGYTKVYHANGETTRREFAGGVRVESTTVTCSANKLQVRQTAETFKGTRKVGVFTDHYDFSLNTSGWLVEEGIRDGQVSRTSTYYRLAP